MNSPSPTHPLQRGQAPSPHPLPASVLVVGSLIMDLVMRVPHHPAPGETVIGSDFGMFLGGKGFNQAVAARRMGARVAMIGRVGADGFGRSLRAALRREEIDVRGLRTDRETGTGVAAPLIDPAGQNSIVVVPRANWRLTPADVERMRARFQGVDCVLLQQEVPFPALAAAIRLARDAGARVLLNAAPARATPRELLAAVDVLIVNESEASLLMGQSVTNADSAFAAALALQRSSGQSVVITLGERGAAALTAGERIVLPAITVPAVDSTGAGDAFCGALAVRLGETGDLREALHWANAAGACAVMQLGAEPSLPRRADVLARLMPDGAERTSGHPWGREPWSSS